MFKIIINQELCKNCGICLEFCVKDVFALDELNNITLENNSNCIGCELCVRRCPDFAISMEEE
jgi:2-oxoglutarate ferredoxin oxidoreductase subunit delta